MKHFKILISILILFQDYNINLEAQNINKLDSIEICGITLGFFNWYINAIKGEHGEEFQPRFVESRNGMTTLDFAKYFENLKKFNFSDSLIMKERESYQVCLNNLDKIKFSDFEAKINDLSDFEKIQCDFGNYYRWTGGQEICDGVQISTIIFLGKNSCVVKVEEYGTNEMKTKDIWGFLNVKLIRQNNTWFINDMMIITPYN